MIRPGTISDDGSESWRILEAALDAVVSVDRSGRILRWNPQAERIFGWSSQEVSGRLLRETIIPQRYRTRHQRGFDRYLATGVGRVIGQRLEFPALHRDGHEFPVELSIVELTGVADQFTAFLRDLSRERETEVALDRAQRERRSFAESVGLMQPGATLPETAERVCIAVRLALAADIVTVMLFEKGLVTTLGSSTMDGVSVVHPRVVSPDRAGYVIERTRAGPWVEMSAAAAVTGDQELGLACSAYAPILSDDGTTVGVLVGASMAADDGERVTGWLPLVSDLAGVASALLTPHLRAGREADTERRSIETLIAERRFASVFQPVVELESRRVVGYEALTRFDEEAPQVVFARARASGIGVELERACLSASLDAACSLPSTSWLSLNASPQLLIGDGTLHELLSTSQHNLIIEITEGVPITDYVAMRAAIARLGPSVQLAIDDAGAGYASLRHIIELRPSVVKLDMGLIRGINEDPIRQAMIAGIVHFADEIGCTLVGEGVETAEEAQALMDLGVRMGQGYLFARPASVEQLTVGQS